MTIPKPSVICNCSKMVVILLLGLLVMTSTTWAQESDSQCLILQDKWEQSYQQVKELVDKLTLVEQTPVEKITKKPMVSAIKGKTIAAQVSDALSEKEELLKSMRKETRSLLTVENKTFNEMQQCLRSAKASKNKEINNVTKKRKALLDKALVCLAEVKEVEGKETVIPYTEAYGQDAYRRSVNNQWQNYQGAYRGYWGY